MRWLNEPKEWSGDASDLTVAVEPETDFWRTTHYGFIRDNGHFADTGQMGVRFRGDFADPRIALRDLPPDEAVFARLDRMGEWAYEVLQAIAENPGLRAPDLAASFGREIAPFKRDVRKLKELGLTISLEVGYQLSPRGTAVLTRRDSERSGR